MDYSEYRDGCWLSASGAWNRKYSGGHWRSNSTGWWYTDNFGWYPTSEWLWIDGKCYYFKSDGYMAKDEWIGNYYVDSSGAWVAGKKKESSSNNANKNVFSAEIKAAYRSKVEEYDKSHGNSKSSGNKYSLIYIDNDDIPELVCDHSGYYMNVYTYYNGNVNCIMNESGYGVGGNPGYCYTERKGLVTNTNADMAGAINYYYFDRLEKGCLVEYDYYLVSSTYNYKKYGFDWNHAGDNEQHYYKCTDSSGDTSCLTEITKAQFNALNLSGTDFISGNKSKNEMLKLLQ